MHHVFLAEEVGLRGECLVVGLFVGIESASAVAVVQEAVVEGGGDVLGGEYMKVVI